MKTNKLKWFWLLITCTGFCFVSCDRSTEPEPAPEPTPNPTQPNNPLLDAERLKVNNFIYSDVKDYYLWTSSMDWSKLTPDTKTDPFAYFEKLRYTSIDQWSTLTDDIDGLLNNFSGIATSYGYELIWGRFSDDTTKLYAIVLFVYPGSPAEQAGLKRGDFIVSLNSNQMNITEKNYMDFYNAPDIILRKAFINEKGALQMDPNPVHMTAVQLYEDPVVKDTIVVKGAHRIGYLCYTNYTVDSEQRLLEVFANFKSKGVTDVVLDLRYNTGGYMHTAELLSSILAPASAVKRKDIFLMNTYNKDVMDYFASMKYDTNEYFTDTLAVNMDLSRLYVLTLNFTASASESTIIGLRPYMDVVKIGKETVGKYYGGSLLSPMILDSRTKQWVIDTTIENWGLYLMMFHYTDRNGYPSFSGGLTPDIYVAENYGKMLPPLGDESDPLFGKAIEQITGQTVGTRAATPSLRSPYSIYDAMLRSPLNGKMIRDFNFDMLKKR